VDASCKKELFMDLCDEHVLLDDGKMVGQLYFISITFAA
jgi:hypothetical protein